MGLFDVYEIVDRSVFRGQNCLNTYFYQSQSDVDAPDASDVADAYIGQVLPAVRDIQNIEVVHTEIRVRNLFDPSDVNVTPMSDAGGYTPDTDLLPIFNAIPFRLQQDNGAVRNGSKRYAGLTEGEVTDGIITDVTMSGNLDDLGTALATTLVHGIIPTFVPVIVKRLLVGGDYVLPEALVDAVLGNVIEAVWDALITSQTSRKIGSGE